MSGSSEGSKRGPKSKRAGKQYEFVDLDGTRWLLGLIVGVAMSGGAVRVGLTRDGGALAIALYQDGEYGVEYITPQDDLAAEVREIAMGWKLPIAMFDDQAGRWIVS